MTRDQLERVLGVLVRQIGDLVGKTSPSFNFIAVVWDVPEGENWPVSRRISTVPPDLVQDAWKLVTDENRRSGPTQIERREFLDH